MKQLLKRLVSFWFLSARSVLLMMRWTVKKVEVMRALKNEFVLEVFEARMFSQLDEGWVGCFRDGVPLIDASLLGLSAVPTLQLASVEINTGVAASSRDSAQHCCAYDTVNCTVGDEKFLRVVRKAHCEQLLHHALVLDVSFVSKSWLLKLESSSVSSWRFWRRF